MTYAGEHDHHKIPSTKNYSVSYPQITLTDISMSNTENKKISLTHELDKGAVIINFIFTSCTAICPVLSSTFAQVQKRFDEINVKNINLISFSIDPERDTPARLKEYAQKFNAGSRWQFFTGTKTDMRRIEDMFSNYRGNKMNHLPYTFIRINKKSPWIRLKGFVGASIIIDEINKASSK
jgi:protein SCO1/2